MERKENRLGTVQVKKLLPGFAIPAIISMLVNAMYNIVDQIFIGQGVGMYGNAATNVAFPLTTLATAVGLLLGIGGAVNFNLAMGRKNEEKAKHIVGSALGSLVIAGVAICFIVRLFIKPMVLLFGATPDVMDYAVTYMEITSLGMPFYVLGIGGNNLIRADGSPTYSMISNVSGAVINAILDPIFIFGFGWGMAGAAWATVIGQVFSAVMVLVYLPRFKTVRLLRRDLIPKAWCIKAITSLGAASCFNQLAMMISQIVMNNVLRHYGERSVYGGEIPIAVVGIVAKVNILFMAVVIGISQGAQPLFGFNYGAAKYDRVRQTYKLSAIAATVVAVLAFLGFMIFPRQIIQLFGSGDELYYQFAVNYFRIFMFCTFLNGIQPLTSNFFASIGKAPRGILLSMTRQIIFLIPLVVVLPMMMGIDGVMYAGPVADGAAGILAIVLVYREFRRMPRNRTETLK